MPRKHKNPIMMTLIQLAYAIGGIGTIFLISQLGACTEHRRVISRSGLLTEFSDQQNNSKSHARSMPTYIHPVFAIPDGQIRHENEDGTITLYTKSIKHLMKHLIHALENGERDLFVDQILSEITIREFHDRGLDPGIAFDELVKFRRDVYRTFHLMPMGESTPGLLLKPLGPNMFRLAASRAGHKDYLWIGIDASFEHGNYKLRWFVR